MNQKFEIKTIQNNNRGLFAKTNFNKHEQIIQSEPLAWATLQSVKSNICNWCLLNKQVVKCSQCKSFYYCSTECQKKDWKYHKLQCKIFSKMSTQKNLSIHKQITTQFVFNIRLYFILNENKQIAQKFYSMCSQQDYQPLQKRQYFQELSLVMMQNIPLQKNQTNMSQLIKQFNIVSINAFTIQDLFYTTQGVSVGIFCPQNYLNHDCNPNCSQVFDGRYMKIITNRNIDKNQQLTISYTSSLLLQKQRSKFLKKNYLFQCFCELCQAQKMVNTQFSYIKCTQCKQPKIKKSNSLKPIQNEDGQLEIKDNQKPKQIKYICTSCNKQIDFKYLTETSSKIKELSTQIQKISTYKQRKLQLLSIKKLIDLKHPYFCQIIQSVYLKAIDQALLLPTQNQQKTLLIQANILLNQILKNLSSWYKVQQEQLLNIKFFNKFNQMSKLAYNLKKLPKCLEYLQKAITSIEKLQLKNKYSEINQLKMRYDQVKIQISIAKTKLMNK